MHSTRPFVLFMFVVLCKYFKAIFLVQIFYIGLFVWAMCDVLRTSYSVDQSALAC